MSEGQHRLESRSDFQRFCATLRAASISLDDIVEGLRALVASELRPLEKSRFAHTIARHLSENFHLSEVRAVASVPWPSEIAMALRSYAPPGDAASVAVPPPEREKEVELDGLLELSHARGSPLTVVFLGDEDEHRQSIERLKASRIQCLRENSAAALRESFGREVVIGLVIGASWWVHGDDARPLRQRLSDVLKLSNLCWMKLVRSATWLSVENELLELSRSLWLAYPLTTRFVVEDKPTITDAELRCLIWAAEDLSYGERSFDPHELPSSFEQQRLIRATTSRYLRTHFPALHSQEPRFAVRPLARRDQGLASLISVVDTEVSFVIKVSSYSDARQEARRFQLVAHGTSLAVDFFCHATQGALVFAPADATRLGKARSLEDLLASRKLVVGRGELSASAPLIDSAIKSLERFSQQIRPDGISTVCRIEFDDTDAVIEALRSAAVAGEAVDLRKLYARGLQALDRTARHAVVHGDAHPGNILFSANNSAILIDYECAGLGPACYDLCVLWIFVFSTRFIAVGDERAMVGLVHDLLIGVPFETLAMTWSEQLRVSVNYEVMYLAARSIEAAARVMNERGAARADMYGIVAIILCRELLNPDLQQLMLRCALAATAAVLALE